MLLRRSLSGLDSIIGPLHQTPPPAGGAPTGDPAPGAPPANGGAAGGAGGAPPAPPAAPPPAGGQPPTPPADDRSGWIPRERFDQVNTEYARLKAAEDARVADEAKKRGDFEALEAQNKTKIAEAEAKALRIARRGAFIAKAAGKVSDAEAAYKLALADGMLDKLEVDDDGNAVDDKAVDKVIDELVKKYEFLKGAKGDRSFGDHRNGAGDGGPVDTSKMDSRDMLRTGYEQSTRTRGS